VTDNGLQINPAIRIFHRRGRLFAWAPSFELPVPVAPADVAILGAALAGDPPVEVARRLLAGARDGGPADLTDKVSAVIERLTGQHLLGDFPGIRERPTESSPVGWETVAADNSVTVGEADHLKLNRNLCLLPGDGDLMAWSGSLQAHVRLPLDVVLYLLRYGDGRQPRQVPTVAGAGEVLERLVSTRLLVATEPPEIRSAAKGARKRGEAVSLGSGDPQAGARPDHRTPVYFVTHSVDHLPLALGMMRAFIGRYKDGALLRRYNPLPIVAMTPAEMVNVYRRFGPGVWLFSNYMWSLNFNLDYSQAVKGLDAANITVHGGPSTPKYEAACRRFMESHAHVDIAVRGEGEITIAEVLERLDGRTSMPTFATLDDVSGVTYYLDRSARQTLVRGPERPRAMVLDQFPSPYLEGVFDNYGGQVVAAILETNRGCPYACTFCDWGSATQQKIRRFDLERIKAEIDWIGRRGVRVLWIADANFGIFKRDIEIAQHIADTKARHGYPREVVVNYPKNATDKIAEIVRILVDAEITGQGIISIQTTDPTTLEVIKRSNIKTRKYDELGRIFRSQNLPLSTDLMIGLPGSTVESFKNDLQYYFDDDITVKAYRTQLLPNSPMADPDYAERYRIRVDDDALLTSTSSYSEQDLQEMLWIWTAFDLADGYALLRYVLRYLQWDHGIKATDFVHRLSRHCLARGADYPAVTWALRFFLEERYLPGGWGPFYDEIAAFARRVFDVPRDLAFDTVLRLNALMMPDEGRTFPDTVELAHDAEAYFRDNERQAGPAERPLSSYPPGRIRIEDPFEMCRLNYEEIEQYDNHQVFFELEAPISRLRSNPSFVQSRAEQVESVGGTSA
jgi:radical SAM superfamily enzyme YgiQ (UPF0313 family)